MASNRVPEQLANKVLDHGGVAIPFGTPINTVDAYRHALSLALPSRSLLPFART